MPLLYAFGSYFYFSDEEESKKFGHIFMEDCVEFCPLSLSFVAGRVFDTSEGNSEPSILHRFKLFYLHSDPS
jgi:hypothetical protein